MRRGEEEGKGGRINDEGRKRGKEGQERERGVSMREGRGEREKEEEGRAEQQEKTTTRGSERGMGGKNILRKGRGQRSG